MTGQEWLSLQVIEEFISSLNAEAKDTKTYSYTSLSEIAKTGKLNEEVLAWKNNEIEKVCVIANVGKDKRGTFFANNSKKGSHWQCRSHWGGRDRYRQMIYFDF